MQEEKEYDYLFKILLLGDAAAGKTCLMLRFCDDKFVEQHNPTVGVDFRGKPFINVLGSKIKLQIWDTHPPTKFRTLGASYYRSAHGIIILQDPSRPLDNLKLWLLELDRFASDSVSKMIVASKYDLANTEKIGDVAQFAAEHGIPFMTISAKDSINCEECIINLVYENLLKIEIARVKGSERIGDSRSKH